MMMAIVIRANRNIKVTVIKRIIRMIVFNGDKLQWNEKFVEAEEDNLQYELQ
jgi:hypothetical protein